jgi:hypothetical protein
MRHARFGNAGSLPGAALRTRLALLALLALLVAGGGPHATLGRGRNGLGARGRERD